MNDPIPEGKWKRTAVGGKTAVNVGGKVLKYLAKKPFLKEKEKVDAKHSLENEFASEIFKGLVLLKGTALKIAQLLSTELDLIPKALRKELEKSYNQVPPLNKALVRKMIRNAFGKPPESVFKSFDHTAFAAASLGQVHLAEDDQGRALAVKIQYPGIGKTIKNDLQLVRNIAKPTPYARFVLPVLEEIELKLLEEIDYVLEAENTSFFHERLKMDHIEVPKVISDLSTDKVLTTEYLEGPSLDAWIAQDPTQKERDRIAELLYDQFLYAMFRLNCLQADPNPGNFIVKKNLTLGLVDFGCVKRFSAEFAELFRETFITMIEGDKNQYFTNLEKMQVIHVKISPAKQEEIYKVLKKSGEWFAKIYEKDSFDFGENPDFIAEGKQVMQETYQYKKYFRPNPELVFINRTHYGLIRIFEKLKARVRFISPHDWKH